MKTISFGDHLTRLSIDIRHSSWVSAIFSRLPSGTIQVLSMPGYSIYCPNLPRNDRSCVHRTLKWHGRHLSRLELLRALEMDRWWIGDFNHTWKGACAAQELILGTRNPEWYEESVWKEQYPIPTLKQYIYGFEPNETVSRWGSKIRRIRIDHIDLTGLDASFISKSTWRHLKILMLQPTSRRLHPVEYTDAKSIDIPPYLRLVEGILEQAPVSLRVLVINAYRFWIQRNSQTKASRGTPWVWATAKSDPVQNDLMSTILDQHDLDFLER